MVLMICENDKFELRLEITALAEIYHQQKLIAVAKAHRENGELIITISNDIFNAPFDFLHKKQKKWIFNQIKKFAL